MGKKKKEEKLVLEVRLEIKTEENEYIIKYGEAHGRIKLQNGRPTAISLYPNGYGFSNFLHTFDVEMTKELLEVLTKMVSIAEAANTLKQ